VESVSQLNLQGNTRKEWLRRVLVRPHLHYLYLAFFLQFTRLILSFK